MSPYTQSIQQLYVAYFSRPADPSGLQYWEGVVAQNNGSTAAVSAAFSQSAEYQAAYAGMSNDQIVNQVYLNLFGRSAEPAGLQYWSNLLDTGALTISNVVTSIAAGAQGSDLTAYDNKVTGAIDFTNSIDTTPEILAYSGDAANAIARNWLSGITTDASLVAAEATMDNTIANITATGGTTGSTYALTTGVDNIIIPTANTIDTVNGLINSTLLVDNSTFSAGDNILGNGLTAVNLILQNNVGTSPEYVTMAGVATLGILNSLPGGSGYLNMDASSYGNVNNIKLSGHSGLDLNVNHLNVATGSVNLNIAGATTGTIYSTGTVNGLNYYASVENNTSNTVGSIASFGNAGIDVTLGKSGYLDLTLSNSAESSAANVSVGDIAVGHINVNVGTSASAETVRVENYAYANGHNATAGNISVGGVNYVIGNNGNAYLTISNEAYVNGKGDALVGNTTVGNVSVVENGKTGDFYGNISNYAVAHTGNATVGDIMIGNISLSGASELDMYVSNEARVYNTGNATAGSIAVGDISMVDGTHTDHSLSLYNYAYAYKGDAAVGDVTVGNVNMTASYSQSLSIDNRAYVSTTGAAMAGNISLGNVVMNAKGTATNDLSVTLEATAGGGAGGMASVGDVTIGNVAMTVASGSNYMEVYQSAHNHGSKTFDANVGNLSIGDISMNNVAATSGGSNYLYIDRYAHSSKGNATAGDVNIGNIAILGNIATASATITQIKGSNYITVYNEAYANSGNATVGTVTIGDVSAKTGVGGNVGLYVDNSAYGSKSADSAGLVTIGNISMQGSSAANLSVTVYDYARSGNAAGITIGNVSLAGTKAHGTESLYVSASGNSTGNVKIGNVAITGANIGLSVENYAKTGNAGSTTVGNITLNGDSNGWNYVYQNANSGSAGTVSVGNVTLGVGAGQSNSLEVSNYASAVGATVGALNIGNVNLAIANTNAGSAAYDNFYAYTNGGKSTGGNITAGNITVSASGVTANTTAAANMNGYVTMTSADGNVTVGNITVTGGVEGAGGLAMDNLANLTSWLNLGAKGTVTVGNIDYAGYAAAATIDASGYTGAGIITGSTGGSAITDNSGTNSMILGNTTMADAITLQDTQNAVTDSGGVITATQSAMDSITGFAVGDTITLAGGIQGAGITQTGPQTWAQFLTGAESAIHSGTAAYATVINGDTYVALNSGGLVGEIIDVVGSHTFGLGGGVLSFAS